MARRQDDRNTTLLALTSSALLLPAYQGALADAQPEFTEVGMRYSKYNEDDITAKKAFGGDSERYDIDVAQFHLLAPVADDWSFALDVAWEDMSGASPWFVGESTSGDPKVIMSGASIEDTRTEVSVTTRYYYDRGNAGLNYVHSDEDDYESNAGGVDGVGQGPQAVRREPAAEVHDIRGLDYHQPGPAPGPPRERHRARNPSALDPWRQEPRIPGGRRFRAPAGTCPRR